MNTASLPMLEDRRHYVYADCKPDGAPFYIGKGVLSRLKSLSRRNTHHTNITKKYSEWRRCVIAGPVTEMEALSLEVAIIQKLGRKGLGAGTLTNKTDGGEGCCGAVRSPEQKAKLSVINTGKKHSSQTLLKMSASQKSRKHSPEQHAKIGVSNTGKKRTIESRAKMSMSHKKLWTPERRAQASETNKVLMTPERRAQLSAITKLSMTPERRAQMSKNAKASMTPERRAKISATLRARKTLNTI